MVDQFPVGKKGRGRNDVVLFHLLEAISMCESRVCGAEPLPSGDNPLCSPLPGSASSESTPDDFVC